jgi:predicted XRE-type DNA-binding protein
MDEDITITESCGNVFIDLGFEPAEAEVMKFRAEVMLRMKERLKEIGWTQAEAARRLGVTQPRISRLLKGKVEDFSLDTLLALSFRAGLSPELHI